MAKSKQSEKAAKREAAKEEREARDAEMTAKLKRRRILVGVIPVIALGLGVGLRMGFGDDRLLGMSLLIGALIWLPLALGLLGMQVPPRERRRASAIDYGNQK